MNWSGDDLVLPTGQRSRYRARDRTSYHHGGNGLLIPAGPQRSASTSGHGRNLPTQIFITNQNRDDHSPVRSSRQRRRHDSRYEDESDDYDDYDDDSPPRRRRHRSRSYSRHRSRSHDRSKSHIHHHSNRTPSPSKSEIERRLKQQEKDKKLIEFEKREEEQQQRHKYEQDRLLMEAQMAEQKKKEEEMKKHVIEEYDRELARKAAKAKEDKEKEDKAFQERVKTTFAAAGYSEESIEQILQNDRKGKEVQKKIVDLRRPTYIKVNRKHLSPDTLDAYSLPWEWDDRDSTFIIIKRWISESDQEILFEHTRRLREGRAREVKTITDTPIELKRKSGELMLVKKRSPSRRRSASKSWIFT